MNRVLLLVLLCTGCLAPPDRPVYSQAPKEPLKFKIVKDEPETSTQLIERQRKELRDFAKRADKKSIDHVRAHIKEGYADQPKKRVPYEDRIYVPDGNVPVFGLDTKKMGEQFPYIEIAGHRMDYDPEVVWYRYALTDYKAYWLPIPMDDKDDPKNNTEIRLLLPARYNEKANKFQYMDGYGWTDKEPPGAERYKEVILQTEERFKKDRQTRRRGRGCPGGRCLV
jgi:hypothetical protein